MPQQAKIVALNPVPAVPTEKKDTTREQRIRFWYNYMAKRPKLKAK